MKPKKLKSISVIVVALFLLFGGFLVGIGHTHTSPTSINYNAYKKTSADPKTSLGSVPGGTNSLGVNPFSFYSKEPAPMGIADYGIGPNNAPYSYSTTSFLGTVAVNSLNTYNSSISGSQNDMTFQLNINLAFYNGNSLYAYWVQDVAFLNTSSHLISFIDNIWNMSSPSANMYNSSVSGNGTLGNSSGTHFYLDWASQQLSGNEVYLTLPVSTSFMVNTSVNSHNQPVLIFEYNDGYGWQTYDNVVFSFVNNLTQDYGFVVDGYNYEPNGYSFYDAELILGGPGGGSSTTDTQSNVNLTLQYWNGHNYQEISNAYNFGSHTAETIDNAVSNAYYYDSNGSLFEEVTAGTGSLEQIYNQSSIGIINMSTDLQSGKLMVNGTSYYFVNGDVNITLGSGYYDLQLYNSNGFLVAQGNFSLKAGEYLPLTASTSTYSVSFTESNLPSGTTWYVNLTSGQSFSSSTNTLTFTAPNGTYSYTIATADKTYSSPPSSGSVIVNGSPQSVSVTFSLVKYTVTFTESGLPSGTTWYVNLSNGQTFSSTASTISFTETNGTYTYTVATTNKIYKPSSSSGSVTVNGSPQSVSVTFTFVTYAVTFTESGLPSGTTWYTNVTNSTGHVFQGSSSTNKITFNLINGTYSFANSTGDKIYEPSSYAGTFLVHGSAVNLPVVIFTPVKYKVTFTETGLPSGSDWYVNITGQSSSGPISGTSFSVSMTNDSYSYTVTTTNKQYTTQQSSGSITVNGTSKSVPITFTKTPSTVSPLSSSDLYGIIGGVAAVAVIAGASITLTKRKRG